MATEFDPEFDLFQLPDMANIPAAPEPVSVVEEPQEPEVAVEHAPTPTVEQTLTQPQQPLSFAGPPQTPPTGAPLALTEPQLDEQAGISPQEVAQRPVVVRERTEQEANLSRRVAQAKGAETTEVVTGSLTADGVGPVGAVEAGKAAGALDEAEQLLRSGNHTEFLAGLEKQGLEVESLRDIAGISGEASSELSDILRDESLAMKEEFGQLAAATSAFRNFRVQPNRAWKNKSSFKKVAGFVGAMIAGFLNPTGRNSMVELLEREIDRDIQVQENEKNRLGQVVNLERADIATQKLVFDQKKKDVLQQKILKLEAARADWAAQIQKAAGNQELLAKYLKADGQIQALLSDKWAELAKLSESMSFGRASLALKERLAAAKAKGNSNKKDQLSLRDNTLRYRDGTQVIVNGKPVLLSTTSVGEQKDQANRINDLMVGIPRVQRLLNFMRQNGRLPPEFIPGRVKGQESTAFIASRHNLLSLLIKSRSGTAASEKEVERLKKVLPFPGVTENIEGVIEAWEDFVADQRDQLDVELRAVPAEVRGEFMRQLFERADPGRKFKTKSAAGKRVQASLDNPGSDPLADRVNADVITNQAIKSGDKGQVRTAISQLKVLEDGNKKKTANLIAKQRERLEKELERQDRGIVDKFIDVGKLVLPGLAAGPFGAVVGATGTGAAVGSLTSDAKKD